VLPFVNEASDTDAEYFSDEITESLINNLSQLPKLRVVPRSLVLVYKGQEPDPRKIARDLNVRAVLTGRVHRRGDTLSIQAELIDVVNLSQLWGQHYDRRVSDILLVQEDISRDIFENLRLKLSVEEKKQLEAFSFYLKGRNYWNKRTEDGLLQGVEYFRKAIEVDPEYAPAYAGLADCYNMLVVYGINQPKEAFPKAKEAATEALKIDDTLAEARTSLAFIKHRWDWDRVGAEKEFQLAIRYKPGYAPAHQWYSSYLVAMGRFDEAIAEAKRAEELEPLSFISNSHLGWILFLAGKNDEAIAHCRRLLEVDPNFFPALRYLGLAYEQKGMHKEAIAEFAKGVKLSASPLMISLLGHAYAVSGNKAEARRILAELDQQKQRYVSPYTVATIYAGLGDRDQAFKWLEKAFEERDIWLMNLAVDPQLTPLRADRRFADLLKRIGLAS
ncbi:MAG TPA: tetratricopeptide repeat protein, partial [Blastocatellia bacterium]|nr:tetratricopeptide repeat protein [Blastocatellia bacterium]